MTKKTEQKKEEELNQEELTEEELEEKIEEVKQKLKKKEKKNKPFVLMSVAILMLCGGTYAYLNANPLNKQEITLQDFEELPEHDVVVVDKGIAEHHEGLAKFLEEHDGKKGLHVFVDEDNEETYALVSGEKGMEPLALMLYGVVDNGPKEMVIGYNYVEASPRFRHDVPSMLLKVEAPVGTEVTGRVVNNEDYEDYKEILARYKAEGFKPMSQAERDKMEEEAWAELEQAEADSQRTTEDGDELSADISLEEESTLNENLDLAED